MFQGGAHVTDRKEIEAILDHYRTAVYAKDVDAFIELYDEDARVFDLWGRWLYRGSAEWRKPAAEWFGSLGTDRSSPEFHDVQIDVGDGVAAVHAFVTYKGLSAECRHSAASSGKLPCGCRHSRCSEVVDGLLPVLGVDLAGADRRDHSRLFLRVLGEDLSRHPVQLADLFVAGLVEDELVDAGLDVGLEHTVEGVLRHPRIEVGLRHPVIERSVERVGVASDLSAVVVEHLVALAHLLGCAEGVPGVRVPGDDLEHPRPKRAEHQRRSGLLHARRPR